jgi:hypothetical protein
MPDRKGVEKALRELEVPELPPDAGSSGVN